MVAAAAVLVAAALVAGCGGDDDGAAPATTSPTATADAGGTDPVADPRDPACDRPAEPVVLGADLVAVREAVTADAGLATAPPADAVVRRCDPVGATTAVVPAGWGDQLPRPSDLPRAGFTIGPSLGPRVETDPVVVVGAARFVGDPPAASFVNDNNARGSLESGTRSPRAGRAIPDGCRALDALPFTTGDGVLRGEVQPFVDCGGDARVWLVAVAFPTDGGQYQGELLAQALTTADLDAALGALASLTADPRHVPPKELPPTPAVPA